MVVSIGENLNKKVSNLKEDITKHHTEKITRRLHHFGAIINSILCWYN
jgi:hypothetical protein